MVGCCVIYLQCGVSSVCYTLGRCAGGVDGSSCMSMLKMADNCFSTAVCFPRQFGMGLDGSRWGLVLERLLDFCCLVCHHIYWG